VAPPKHADIAVARSNAEHARKKVTNI